MTILISLIVALMGFGCGYFVHELRNTLKRIELALRVLVERKDKVEAQEVAKKKGMSFGAPMSMAELADMEDQERIDALNANM